MQGKNNYRREQTWGDLYDRYGVERDEDDTVTDLRGFAELFHERGLKGFNPDEKGDRDDLTMGKRHRYPAEPQDSLDLHGVTREESTRLIRRFIIEARQRRLMLVLIVTGKGINSEGGVAKLRPQAIETLNEMKREQMIRDFKSAEARHGGFGALYVYIK